VSRVVLQVAEGNRAQALYRRAGFQEAWRYRYWK
jgi:ribosomal protein S18 acetylase RimI-like enzyme